MTFSPQRHFAYKHPTFGRKQRPKGPHAWEGSVYFWWWSYLKRSDRYLETCAHDGVGKLADLYAHFGDVRDGSFKDWWSKESRGLRLFAEPRTIQDVRVISSAAEYDSLGKSLLIAFPLDLPKRHLLKRARELIALNHGGRRGFQTAKKSQAAFRVIGQPNVRALRAALAVFDMWSEHRGKLPLWEIGNRLPHIFKAAIVKSDNREDLIVKKNRLAATVSRYLRRANESIAAVESGSFPRKLEAKNDIPAD